MPSRQEIRWRKKNEEYNCAGTAGSRTYYVDWGMGWKIQSFHWGGIAHAATATSANDFISFHSSTYMCDDILRTYICMGLFPGRVCVCVGFSSTSSCLSFPVVYTTQGMVHWGVRDLRRCVGWPRRNSMSRSSASVWETAGIPWGRKHSASCRGPRDPKIKYPFLFVYFYSSTT